MSLTVNDIAMIRQLFQEEIRPIIGEEVRPIVREEIYATTNTQFKRIDDRLETLENDVKEIHLMLRKPHLQHLLGLKPSKSA